MSEDRGRGALLSSKRMATVSQSRRRHATSCDEILGSACGYLAMWELVVTEWELL
jgi:hypothetical protein